jgi:cell division protein FtsB
MKSKFFFHIFICVFFSSFFLYSYVNKQNDLTKLRIAIPQIAGELQALQEKNTALKYEIERFENPEHLMELARQERFSHLMHPLMHEVVMLREGIALQDKSPIGLR